MKMFRKMLFIGLVSGVGTLSAAVSWRGLDENNWYSGEKLSGSSLQGKVVLVDCWGVNCGPCRALLPQLEAYVGEMKGKPFVLIGSHRQGNQKEKILELVKANKLTYPIYGYAGLSENEPSFRGLPFLYVVNAQGKVVYSGSRFGEAKEAVKTALRSVTGPDSLCGVELKKYKALKSSLVFGKNVEGLVKRLEADAEGKDAAKAAEAKEILKDIEETRESLKSSIDTQLTIRPSLALAQMKKLTKTWPSLTGEYTEKIAELSADPLIAQVTKLRESYEKFDAQVKAGGVTAEKARKAGLAAAKKFASLGEGEAAAAKEARMYLRRLKGEVK